MKEIPDEDQDAATDGHVQGFARPNVRYADGLEEASVVVESGRENRSKDWQKLHGLGSQLWILWPRCELSEALQTEGMAVLNVGLWPLPDMTARDSDVLFRGQSGHPLGLDECLLMTRSGIQRRVM